MDIGQLISIEIMSGQQYTCLYSLVYSRGPWYDSKGMQLGEQSDTANVIILNQGPGMIKKTHLKINVSWQWFSNMASDWLAARLSANQMPGLKTLLTEMDFKVDIS